MNWPFVRRSKYENLIFKNHIKNKKIEAQRNAVISLQEELSMELSSHKETKEELKETQKQRHSFFNTGQLLERKNKDLNKELRETKDALKIAQEDLRQHQMALSAADLRADKAKSEISKIRGYLRKIAKEL